MNLVLWGGFVTAMLALIALDLGVFNRRPHIQSAAEATGWSVFWIALALSFNAAVFYIYGQHWAGFGLVAGRELGGPEAGLQFFTGYLIEKSLSLDNIFAIALIFTHFRIPAEQQHRLLFWGVVGALALRGLMIASALTMLHLINWIVYVFGLLLIYTALKVLAVGHANREPGANPLLRFLQRWVELTPTFAGSRFFLPGSGPRRATPLAAAFVLIVSTDVLYAVDSIPAILAVTSEPFLVFSSNVCAVLGLRSLYFLLASLMPYLRYFKLSLSALLVFVGIKMLLSHHLPIGNGVTLVVVVAILGTGIAASLFGGRRDTKPLASPLSDELAELVRLSYLRARRLVILVIGSTMLVIGALLLVLPGPGVPLMLLALTVLASEFLWARMLLRRAREQTDHWWAVLGEWRIVRALRRMLRSRKDRGQRAAGPEIPPSA